MKRNLDKLTPGRASIARASAVLVAAGTLGLGLAIAFGVFNARTTKQAVTGRENSATDFGVDCGHEGLEERHYEYMFPAIGEQPATPELGLRMDALREFPRMDMAEMQAESVQSERAVYKYIESNGRATGRFTLFRYGNGWRVSSSVVCPSLHQRAG